jgi:hypothetical protein
MATIANRRSEHASKDACAVVCTGRGMQPFCRQYQFQCWDSKKLSLYPNVGGKTPHPDSQHLLLTGNITCILTDPRNQGQGHRIPEPLQVHRSYGNKKSLFCLFSYSILLSSSPLCFVKWHKGVNTGRGKTGICPPPPKEFWWHDTWMRNWGDLKQSEAFCRTWSFRGGDYEACRLLGCGAVWAYYKPTFQKNVSPPSSG